MIEHHLTHKGKLTEQEVEALEIKHFFEMLYPVTSVYIERQKQLSKMRLTHHKE